MFKYLNVLKNTSNYPKVLEVFVVAFKLTLT